MDAIFGSALDKLKSDIELLRVAGSWKDILVRIRDYEGERDVFVQFFEGECLLEIQCQLLLEEKFSQRSGHRFSPRLEGDSAIHLTATKSGEENGAPDSLEVLLSSRELLEPFLNADESVGPIFKQLASILLAKLCYLKSGTEEAMKYLATSDLDEFKFSEESSPRILRVLAEGLAIKAEILQKMENPTKADISPKNDEDQHIWSHYELAVLLALHANESVPATLLLQDATPETKAMAFGPAVHCMIARCAGPDSDRPAEMTRWFLQFLQFHSLWMLRAVLAWQLTSEFLHGIERLDPTGVTPPREILATLQATAPADEDLFLVQKLASNWVIEELAATQQAEYPFLRETSLRLSDLVLSPCTTTFLRLDQPELLESTWGWVMARCYESPVMRVKYAKVLVEIGRFESAVKHLQNLLQSDPGNREALILIAGITAEHPDLGLLTLGAEYAEKASKLADSDEAKYSGLVFLGIIYSQVALEEDSAEFGDRADRCFTEAMALRPSDFRLLFNVALHQAHQRNISAASTTIQTYLDHYGTDSTAWHLNSLILTALGRHVAALELLEEHMGEDIATDWELFLTNLSLLERLDRVNDALIFAKNVLLKCPISSRDRRYVESSLDFQEDPVAPDLTGNSASDRVPLLESPSRPPDLEKTQPRLGDQNSTRTNGEMPEKPDSNGLEHATLKKPPSPAGANESQLSGVEVTTTENLSVKMTVDVEVSPKEPAKPGLLHQVLDSVAGVFGLGAKESGDAANHENGVPEHENEVMEEAKTMILETALDDPEMEIKAMTSVMETVYEKIVQIVPFTSNVDEEAELAQLKTDMDTWNPDPSRGEWQRSLLLARIAQLQLKLDAVGEAEESLFTAQETLVACHFVEYTKGLLALRHCDPVTAKTSFELAIQLEPGFLPAWLGLLDLAVKSENSGLIQEYLRQMRNSCRDEPESWYLSGQFHAELWEHEDGDVFLDKAQRLLTNRPLRSFRIFAYRVSIFL